jgi:hypothetical protein
MDRQCGAPIRARGVDPRAGSLPIESYRLRGVARPMDRARRQNGRSTRRAHGLHTEVSQFESRDSTPRQRVLLRRQPWGRGAHHFAACSVCARIHWLMSSVNVQPAMNSSRDVGTGTGSGLAVGSFTLTILGPVMTITAGADAVRK